jgi:hypothetical protein
MRSDCMWYRQNLFELGRVGSMPVEQIHNAEKEWCKYGEGGHEVPEYNSSIWQAFACK